VINAYWRNSSSGDLKKYSAPSFINVWVQIFGNNFGFFSNTNVFNERADLPDIYAAALRPENPP